MDEFQAFFFFFKLHGIFELLKYKIIEIFDLKNYTVWSPFKNQFTYWIMD